MIAAPPVPLGHGYSATVRVVGTTYTYGVKQVLELRHGSVLLHRFRGYGEQLPLQTADFTGDGVRDVLAENYVDGSGGCGTYRLYAGAHLREIYVHRDCLDTFKAQLSPSGLTTWIALGWSKDPKTDGYIHCCWLHWLRTDRRWVDGRLRIVARSEVPDPR